MKTLHPPRAEFDEAPNPPVGGFRRRAQRRRYLYEIEFFDAGHTGRLRAIPERDDAAELASPGFDESVFGIGPRDPRLREIITAAAQGWVIGRLT